MDPSFTSEDTTSPSLKRPAEDSEASDASPAEKRVRFDLETIEVLRSAPTWDQLLEQRSFIHSIAGLDDLECLGVDGNIATLRGTYLGETRSFKWEFKPSTLPPRFRSKDAHRRARVKQTARKHTVLDKHDRQHLTAVIAYLDSERKMKQAVEKANDRQILDKIRAMGVTLQDLNTILDPIRELKDLSTMFDLERAENQRLRAENEKLRADNQELQDDNQDLRDENRGLEEKLRG
jgi:hypothetical protein